MNAWNPGAFLYPHGIFIFWAKPGQNALFFSYEEVFTAYKRSIGETFFKAMLRLIKRGETILNKTSTFLQQAVAFMSMRARGVQTKPAEKISASPR